MSVDASLFGDQDFIAVRAALIAEVGAVEAIVLTRIHFRASESYRHAYERDGQWWWRAPVPTISQETGLSEKQVRRAIEVLAEAGHIVAEQHQIEGRYDRAKSVRVNFSEGPMHVPHRADEDVPYRADVPISQEEEDTPPTPSPIDLNFERAWEAWPKKTDKKVARRAFEKAIGPHLKAARSREIEGVPADFADWTPVAFLVDTIRRYGTAYGRTTPPKFIPGLSVWLNRERWTDPLPVEETRGAYKPEPAQNTRGVPLGHRLVRDESGIIIGTEPIT